ncbi:MAG: histidine kinase [Wenzhouxiangellaceae bacterium]
MRLRVTGSANAWLWLLLTVWLIYYLWVLIYWHYWYQSRGIEISSSRLALMGLFDWAFWVVAAPFILWLTRRHSPVKLWAGLLLHLPASLLSAVMAIAVSSFGRILLEARPDQDYFNVFESRLYYEGSWYFLIYWVIVGIYAMIERQQAYRTSTEQRFALQLSNEQLQRHLVEARLRTLKSQIQPHFLFNSLHSISSLMDINVKQARRVLVDLAALLRLALKISERNAHSLQDEFDWLEKYLALESVRFAGSLNVELKLPQELQSQEIPCLLLQPLVENALKHGAPQQENGLRRPLTLTICATSSGDTIKIAVCDDGQGLKEHAEQDGFGLRLVREAIASLALVEGRLQLSDNTSGGVCATISWRRTAHEN